MCVIAILISKSAQVWQVLTRDHTVLPATHTFIHICGIIYPAVTPQPQSITVF